MKRKTKKKEVVIFWRTDEFVKRRLLAICKRQKRHVPYSTMATRIFKAALKNPKIMRAA